VVGALALGRKQMKPQAADVRLPYRPHQHPSRLTWADIVTFWRARCTSILGRRPRRRGRHAAVKSKRPVRRNGRGR